MKTFLKRLLITALLISIIIPHTNTQYAKAEEIAARRRRKKAAVPVDGGRLPENERANGNAIS